MARAHYYLVVGWCAAQVASRKPTLCQIAQRVLLSVTILPVLSLDGFDVLEYLAQLIGLYRLLDAVDLVPLQEPGPCLVNVTSYTECQN